MAAKVGQTIGFVKCLEPYIYDLILTLFCNDGAFGELLRDCLILMHHFIMNSILTRNPALGKFFRNCKTR